MARKLLLMLSLALSAVFCFPVTSEGDQSGKVIIRSLPLKCDVSFLDRDMDKADEQIIVENVPAGTHSVTFKYGGETLGAEVEIQPGITSLVNGSFSQRKVFVTPQVYVGRDGAPMVLIPAGDFQMGSELGESDEFPVHKIYLDAFYMDALEVTNGMYKKFMDATGHKAPRYWSDSKYNAPDQPVVGVTWSDAKAYCEWSGKRLPTEAEWEKAARGGLVGKTYPWGDNVDRPVAGDRSGEAQVSTGGTLPAGSLNPNGYGLYNMDGNAWEWCLDWYSEDYYSKSPDRNPGGPDSGDARVMRGGSWFADVNTPLPVSYRYSYVPNQTSNLIGLRCVASP